MDVEMSKIFQTILLMSVIQRQVFCMTEFNLSFHSLDLALDTIEITGKYWKR